jgi:uncharacterized protein involved in cysteine biosynthesis
MKLYEGTPFSIFWKSLLICLAIGFVGELIGIPDRFDLTWIPEWIRLSFKIAGVIAIAATLLQEVPNLISAQVAEAVSEQLEKQLTERFELMALERKWNSIDDEGR